MFSNMGEKPFHLLICSSAHVPLTVQGYQLQPCCSTNILCPPLHTRGYKWDRILSLYVGVNLKKVSKQERRKTSILQKYTQNYTIKNDQNIQSTLASFELQSAEFWANFVPFGLDERAVLWKTCNSFSSS